MKKSVKILLVIFSSLILIAVIWIAVVQYSYGAVIPYASDRVYSSDGSRVVIPSIDNNKDNYEAYLLVHIEVRDVKSGKTLFQVQTRASDRMRWSVHWVDNKIVKLDSVDIGAYCWAESDDGTWKETKCP